MIHPGASRRRLTRVLKTAYAGGLLSDDTFASRVDSALNSRLIDVDALIGDLSFRQGGGRGTRLYDVVRGLLARRSEQDVAAEPGPVLLALDWDGGQTELLIGRDQACDVVLADSSVSRQHARLVFRDAKWIIHDLRSTNGTVVNGTRVGRAELRPGDSLVLGTEWLRID